MKFQNIFAKYVNSQNVHTRVHRTIIGFYDNRYNMTLIALIREVKLLCHMAYQLLSYKSSRFERMLSKLLSRVAAYLFDRA